MLISSSENETLLEMMGKAPRKNCDILILDCQHLKKRNDGQNTKEKNLFKLEKKVVRNSIRNDVRSTK